MRNLLVALAAYLERRKQFAEIRRRRDAAVAALRVEYDAKLTDALKKQRN